MKYSSTNIYKLLCYNKLLYVPQKFFEIWIMYDVQMLLTHTYSKYSFFFLIAVHSFSLHNMCNVYKVEAMNSTLRILWVSLSSWHLRAKQRMRKCKKRKRLSHLLQIRVHIFETKTKKGWKTLHYLKWKTNKNHMTLHYNWR